MTSFETIAPNDESEVPEPIGFDTASSGGSKMKWNLPIMASDVVFGCTIAVFAAILAIGDLGGGKYGDDELQTANDKASNYAWYQSKSIKESLAEGQRDLLKTLLSSGAVRAQNHSSIQRLSLDFDKKVEKYRKEKNEILLGSAAVGKANWIQDVDGKLGEVVGTKELEQKLALLGRIGDRFDLSNLFLQLSLVLGAIGIVVRGERQKSLFFAALVVLGLIGTLFCGTAYYLTLQLS